MAGESYVWNIAMARSLCEMVRRVPTTLPELRACWGFGGKGLRAQRHGDFLLDALSPHVHDLRTLHAAQAAQALAAPPAASLAEPLAKPSTGPPEQLPTAAADDDEATAAQPEAAQKADANGTRPRKKPLAPISAGSARHTRRSSKYGEE